MAEAFRDERTGGQGAEKCFEKVHRGQGAEMCSGKVHRGQGAESACRGWNNVGLLWP